MRNTFSFWGVLLLVEGVFGVDVTVMKGDSVTLKHQAEIKRGDSANWKFNDIIIAKKRTAGNFYKSEGDDGRFKNCLNLEQQTGYLTITNITSDHAGPYTLNIKKSTNETSKIFSVTVTDNVTSLSVLKGDTVTLHTGVTGDQIQWKFGDQELNGPDDKRWRNIDLENEHRDLTITNIQSDQSGEYELKIDTSSMILQRKLHIKISGEMKTVSVKEGDPVILETGLILQINDQIMWKFKDQLIAGTNDKLSINRNGSLIIFKSRLTDSGDYHLTMSSSSYTIQRNISVTVKGVFTVDVSVMKGDSVTLIPHTVIPEDDTARWYFGDKIIAKINKADGHFSTSEGDDGRFKCKLNLDKQTGSLTITNITPDNAGLYKLQIMSTTETFEIFSVTVTAQSKGDVAAIFLGVALLLVFIAVVIYCCRKY